MDEPYEWDGTFSADDLRTALASLGDNHTWTIDSDSIKLTKITGKTKMQKLKEQIIGKQK